MRNSLKLRLKLGNKSLYLLLAIVVAVYLTLAVGQALTKNPWCDEGWFANPAFNLITRGSMGTSVIEPTGSCQVVSKPGVVLRGLDRHTYWVMPLHILAQAVWYKLVGFSLISMRSLSIAWGLVAIFSWFAIVRVLSGNNKVALLAMLFVASDFMFISVASFGRMDMMCAALGFAAIAAYLGLRERNLKLAVLASQTLVVASGLTHPNGVLPFFGVLFLTLYLDRSSINWRHLLIAATPYAVGAAGLGLYILQSPGDFLAQVGGNGGSERLSGLASPLTAIKEEITEKYMHAFGFGSHSSSIAHLAILVLAGYIVAIITAICVRRIRQHRGYRALLILTAIYFVIQVFFNQNLPHYLVHMVPMYAAIFAVFTHWCWTNRSMPRWMVAAAACGFLVINLGGSLHPVLKNPYQRNYLTATDYLKRNSNRTTLVMGSAALGFELGFTDGLVDDVLLGYHTGKRGDFIVVEDLYYSQTFENLRSAQPEAYQYITQVLDQYREVYSNSYYKIYARQYSAAPEISAVRP